jgi:hypothetical protein
MRREEHTMTERLQSVLTQIEHLPPEEQDQLAAVLEEQLAEHEWEGLLQKPGSRAFLKELVEEGQREHAAGETEEVGDTLG